jgi:hypothetical protein
MAVTKCHIRNRWIVQTIIKQALRLLFSFASLDGGVSMNWGDVIPIEQFEIHTMDNVSLPSVPE